MLISRQPARHAASHQNGGSDEIATAAPAASAIPKATASGTLAVGWLPIMVGSGVSHAAGAVPDPGAVAGSTRYLREDGSWATPPSGAGSVTSVALSMPAEFSVSGSPVTSSGTLAVSKANQNANLVYAGPSSGAAAAPTFRPLVAADLPALALINYLLNGGMDLKQRFAPGSANGNVAAGTDAYIFDQWKVNAQSGGSINAQRIDTNGALETGIRARFYARYSVATASTKFAIYQPLEGIATLPLAGQSITFQCKLKASASMNVKLAVLQRPANFTIHADLTSGQVLTANTTPNTQGMSVGDGVAGTGIPGGAIVNSVGFSNWTLSSNATATNANVAITVTPAIDTLPPASLIYTTAWSNSTGVDPTFNGTPIVGSAATCAVTTSWQLFSVTVTAPADAKNLIVILWTDRQLTTSETLSMTEAGLYLAGSAVTAWQPRLPAQELLLCQRYYSKTYDADTAPGSLTTNGCLQLAWASGWPYGTTGCRFPVTMRALPTVTFYSSNTGAAGKLANAGGGDVTGSANTVGTNGYQPNCPGLGAGAVEQWHHTAEAAL